jgi:hypothetical protein
MDVNAVFTAIPCCGCSSARRDAVVARLGALYLALREGQAPQVPTRAELLRGCCRSDELIGPDANPGLTILIDEPFLQRAPPEPPPKKGWW